MGPKLLTATGLRWSSSRWRSSTKLDVIISHGSRVGTSVPPTFYNMARHELKFAINGKRFMHHYFSLPTHLKFASYTPCFTLYSDHQPLQSLFNEGQQVSIIVQYGGISHTAVVTYPGSIQLYIALNIDPDKKWAMLTPSADRIQPTELTFVSVYQH